MSKWPAKQWPTDELLALVDGKACTKCREVKPVSEYGKNKLGKHGLTSRCKPCLAEGKREYRAKNRDKLRARDREYYRRHKHKWSRNYNLFDRYGITLEEFEEKSKEQGGVCAICRTKPEGKANQRTLFVDHDHTTGRVRGLLCSSCNSAIGLMKDDKKTAERAAEYLEKWEK